MSSSAATPRTSAGSVRSPSTTRSSSEFVASNGSSPRKPALRPAVEFENAAVCGALNQMSWKYVRKIRTLSTIGSDIPGGATLVFGFFPGEADRPVSAGGALNTETI